MNALFPQVEERRTLVFTSVNNLTFEARVIFGHDGDCGIFFPNGDFVVYSEENCFAQVYSNETDIETHWDYEPVDSEKHIMSYQLAANWGLDVLIDCAGRTESDFVFANVSTD